MATILNPFFVSVDGDGHVRASARLYFYETGTSTPQATYSDSALSVTNTNPVVADSNGLFPAIYLGDPPDYVAYKAILKTSDDVTVSTIDPIAGAPLAAPISAALLRGYISGLERTANTTTTLTESAGVAADDTNTFLMQLATGTVNCATVGVDGIDAGALTVTTTYHRFAIAKTDGTTARLVSASPSSPTMPSGYVYKRRVGSFRTNISGQIIDHLQSGDYFLWATGVVDMSSVTFTSASTNNARTMTVPTGIAVVWMGTIEGLSGNVWNLTVHSPGTTAPANAWALSGDASITASGQFAVMTDTSGQVLFDVSTTVGGVGVTNGVTYGWIDRRGKE